MRCSRYATGRPSWSAISVRATGAAPPRLASSTITRTPYSALVEKIMTQKSYRTGRVSGVDAFPVVDRVVAEEVGAEACAVGAALVDSDLAGIGIEHDVGLAVGGQREEAHGLLAAVDEQVCALLAAWERDDLARLELAPAGRCAQAHVPGEHDDQLLLAEVRVVGVGGLSGRQLPETRAEPPAAGLTAHAGAAHVEPGVLAGFVEARIEDVRSRHARVSLEVDSLG